MGGGGWGDYGDYGDWANCTISGCKPTGTFIPWAVELWCPDIEDCDWERPQPEDTSECTLNAAINYCYTGNPSSTVRNLLQSCGWKRTESCPDSCKQKFIPDNGPKGLQVYHVARYGPYIGCDIKFQSHAMCALFRGTNLELEKNNFSKWQFFQYGDTDIQIGTGCYAQIPKPLVQSETVEVRISHISGISLSSYPSLVAGPRIVTFEIYHDGHVTPI